MKTLKSLLAIITLNIFSLPIRLMAQDGGTYIDNLNVQDSSYMEQDLMAATEKSGSNTLIIIIIIAVVVAAAAFFFLRKKRK